MTAATLEIARHELWLAVKTKRLVALAAMYLGAAVLGGLAYVVLIRFVEQQALKLLTEAGTDPSSAANAVTLAGQQGYQQFVAFFAGVAPADVAPAIRDSLVLPALLWGSLAFLPLLVVLSSYDQLAQDLASRSILYTVLRAPRRAVLLGKLLAHTVLFVGLTLLAAVALVLMAGSLLASFSPLEALDGLLRVTLLLLPYGLCYLGLAAFCSAAVRQPSQALLAAFGLMLALRVLGWFRHIPAEHPFGLLRHLEYLSPASYHAGLWQAGIVAPLTSAAAYLGFGVLFTALAAWRLGERDL